MKKVKITPILLLFPISIIIYILDIYWGVWTPFSLFFIIGFVLIMCLILLLDRAIIIHLKLKKVWIIEIICIILVIAFFLRKYI